MEERLYEIAEEKLLVKGEKEWFCKEWETFRTANENEGKGKSSVIRITCRRQRLEPGEIETVLQAENMKVLSDPDYFYVKYLGRNSLWGCQLNQDKPEAVIYVRDAVSPEDFSFAVRDIFFFYLQKLGKLAIHSASIIYREQAWLFSAPSGTGKSTHVRQWKEMGFPYEDLNGDIAICYIRGDNSAVAASTPWCGTSGIYSNRIEKLGGVFFLQRDFVNLATKMGNMDGILRLAARSISPVWTKEQAEQNLNVCEQIAAKIELAKLSCRPNPEAAGASKKYIDIRMNGKL